MPARASFTVATTQYAVDNDVAANLNKLLRRIDEAADNGADLVVFPEFTNYPSWYRDQEHCWNVSVDQNGEFVHAIRNKARERRVWVAFNASTRGEFPTVYDMNYLINRDGEVVGTVCKQVFIFIENFFMTRTYEEATVFDTELGRIGFYTCMDGVIPETPRAVAVKGAQVLINSLNSMAYDEGSMHVPVRAVENGVWVISSCKSGPIVPQKEMDEIIAQSTIKRHQLDAPGESQVVAPDGRVLAKGGWNTDEIVYAVVEPAMADDKARPGVGDLMADRNPAAYAPLLLPNDQLPLLTNPPRQQVGETRVATAQVNAAHGTEVATLRGMDLIEEAADGGAKIIVLSELFPFPQGAVAADPEAAAHISQDVAAHIAMLAAQYDVLIATSLVEKGHHGQYHHTAYLWGKDGLIGSYRQVHLREGDRVWATPGTEFRAFDTPLGRIGLMVGHDGLFIESARVLALLGADVILYPTTWTLDWEPELAMLERSAENRVSILAAARMDSPVRRGSVIAHIPVFTELRRYHGRLSPSFTTEAPASTEIVLFQTINPSASRNKLVSPATDVILNRRAELYAPLTRPSHPTVSA